jgi:hypothetical protein
MGRPIEFDAFEVAQVSVIFQRAAEGPATEALLLRAA